MTATRSTGGIERLREAGVGIWLDDLSRDDLVSGRLAELIASRGVTGVTTNPTIFAKAVTAHRDAYAEQLRALASVWSDDEDTALALMVDDVRAACDALRPVHEATGGADGFVSIEVRPGVAHDVDATLAEVRRLWAAVDRPNLLVKIPSTPAGVVALEEATAAGWSINMTLLFDLGRYREVRAAYAAGLRRAHAAGIDLAGIRSVASFFVSRVDAEVDRRIDALGRGLGGELGGELGGALGGLGGAEAARLRGTAAVANARLAYAHWERSLGEPEWRELAAAGANPQRPLWASTGVKDPAMRDTRYIENLVAAGVIDTMPVGTLEAVHDHGRIAADTVHGTEAASQAIVDQLTALGSTWRTSPSRWSGWGSRSSARRGRRWSTLCRRPAPPADPAQERASSSSVSTTRLEKPHSLSYQATTFTWRPSARVSAASKIDDAGWPVMSLDTSGASA